jgi:hypothetical protein
MNRLATALLCTFLLASVASATPEPAQPVPAPEQMLLLPGALCSGPADAATFSLGANYCGECAIDSHCTLICEGHGHCAPADYNPRCGVCICS